MSFHWYDWPIYYLEVGMILSTLMWMGGTMKDKWDLVFPACLFWPLALPVSLIDKDLT